MVPIWDVGCWLFWLLLVLEERGVHGEPKGESEAPCPRLNYYGCQILAKTNEFCRHKGLWVVSSIRVSKEADRDVNRSKMIEFLTVRSELIGLFILFMTLSERQLRISGRNLFPPTSSSED